MCVSWDVGSVCIWMYVTDTHDDALCCSSAGALPREIIVTQVHASGNAMGTAGAKAFGDALLVNKTIQHLNVSDNSFGKVQKGDKVKLKSSGEMCTVKFAYSSGNVFVIKPDSSTQDDVKPSEFEWESQVPAFCAGLAASTSLLSVRDFCHACTNDVVC